MILLGVLLFVVAVGADERDNRASIQRVVEALNAGRTVDLFRDGADNELPRLMGSARSADTPWSEVTRPRIVVGAIRFITADFVLVDGANTPVRLHHRGAADSYTPTHEAGGRRLTDSPASCYGSSPN